ncbi:hypothetical protein FDJ70_09645 [Clostridium botulinum]|uniref:hypothetical protein n=1 Tax=Clostridium botulinum TaxID=1491 RepID=UPI0013F89EC3|nr:hypothetical protein [Clostridium botulinum]MCD3245377.1 hypothetical protein [Clostridium botulinum C]MCD3261756.1 hypothetical protein [Clostridium botulinum C]NFV47917.1 hypothetical protein [Clostridium botulinum]
MLENVKIQDKEKLKLHCKRLKQFQKEMRCIDMKNIDELQEEYVTYLKKNRPNATLSEMDAISEVFEFMRNKIKQDN